MSFWFDHVPESYPDYMELVDQAGLRSVNGGPCEGINYLLGVVASLPFSSIKDEYSDYVRFRFAEDQLANSTISTEQKIGVFTELFTEPTCELANTVADLGKYRSSEEDEGERQIGLRLLKYAADTFEKVVSGFDVQTPFELRFEIVVEDYARVASLQDRASDKTAAAATASMVAPHLIALGKEQLTEDQQRELDRRLQLTALHIDDANPAMTEELLQAMSEDEAENTRYLLEQKNITRLIQSVSEDDIDGLLQLFGDKPGVGFWREVFSLVEDENNTTSLERARWLVEHVDRVFPTLLDDAHARLLTLEHVEQVLFFTGRDDLLARYYRSVVAAESAHKMSKFAGKCGARDDVKRFSAMIRLVGLNASQSSMLYKTYFEPKRDERKS